MTQLKIIEHTLNPDVPPDYDKLVQLLANSLNLKSNPAVTVCVIQDYLKRVTLLNPKSQVFYGTYYQIMLENDYVLFSHCTYQHPDTLPQFRYLILCGSDMMPEFYIDLPLATLKLLVEQLSQYTKLSVCLNEITVPESFLDTAPIKAGYKISTGLILVIPKDVTTMDEVLSLLTKKQRSDIRRARRTPYTRHILSHLTDAAFVWSTYQMAGKYFVDAAYDHVEFQYLQLQFTASCATNALGTLISLTENNVLVAIGAFLDMGLIDHRRYLKFSNYYSNSSFGSTGINVLAYHIEKLISTSRDCDIVLDFSAAEMVGVDNSYANYKTRFGSNRAYKFSFFSALNNNPDDIPQPPYYDITNQVWVLEDEKI